ncbi:hypothetical protein THAOC_10820 [Thalassiosira oceanica]|uniref:Uncharacterized protein n=1 Tax=Thalassiosira oceanica TaxID=159749 RepID=K0SSV2_THAOC|nr:hypothetical protein THAOC_10820 [Thalassiosira oceanica]|eukprot:EJK68049.1 hypothetical protein THAOC_10820 [Thalassiosira oceanica]
MDRRMKRGQSRGRCRCRGEAKVEADVEAEVDRGRSPPTRSEVEAEVPCFAKPPADWAGRRSGPCPPAQDSSPLPGYSRHHRLNSARLP